MLEAIGSVVVAQTQLKCGLWLRFLGVPLKDAMVGGEDLEFHKKKKEIELKKIFENKIKINKIEINKIKINKKR